MNQEIGAGAVRDDVLIVAGIGREHRDAAAVLEAIAVTRLDHVAVVDLERDHLDAVLIVDDAVAVELADVDRNAGGRQLLVGDADLDVGRVGALEILHQGAGTSRPDHAIRRGARAEMRLEPAGEPHVGDARGVIGVVVGEKLHVDPADRDLELKEPDGGAAPRAS